MLGNIKHTICIQRIDRPVGCMRIKKQQLELDRDQRSGSKLGVEYIKAMCCHLAYLTYMRSKSCEKPG